MKDWCVGVEPGVQEEGKRLFYRGGGIIRGTGGDGRRRGSGWGVEGEQEGGVSVEVLNVERHSWLGEERKSKKSKERERPVKY